MKNARTIALIAGFGFFLLALLVQGIVPYTMKEATVSTVAKTVRTPLGELEVMTGKANPYTELAQRGREVYTREGCWYCHSQYLRPTAREDRRWGPIAEVGEYAYDRPHLFGTRRIGPDLTRVGGKYGDDWHIGHYYDPRMIVPDSIMPRFEWFFREEGDSVELTDDGRAVIAFVQGLGMNKGKWRDQYPYQIVASGSASIETEGSISHGKEVYERRCVGCHGEKGDGKGPAARFFTAAKPRDFTFYGIYKFRSTPTGSLPQDADLFRTITVGIRGTAMPPWFNLSEADRWDVVHYIKTFTPDFKDYPPDPSITMPRAPKSSQEMIVRGKQVYDELKCWECHGREGKGDGEKAADLTDDWGDPIQPANFTTGIFKSGPRPEDMFRTMMTGLNGTPMPSYIDSLTVKEDAWALSYYLLSLSADVQ